MLGRRSKLPLGRARAPHAAMVFVAALPLFLFGGVFVARSGLIERASSASASFDVPGSRLQYISFEAPSLARTMTTKVYLPPDYAKGSKRYPVLYMLHGLDPNIMENWEWQDYGIFPDAERLMRTGAIPPFIIVLPQGEQSYWVDHADGPPWGEYLAHDVVEAIDSRYRTIADPAHRAVGGLSMGADGALQVALNHPDVFGIVGAHSPALRPYDQVAPYFGGPDYFEAHYPVTLVQREPEVARNLIIELDVGDSDVWLASTTSFHYELQSLGIDHVFNRWPGEHDGYYWGGHLDDYLRFYAGAFAAKR